MDALPQFRRERDGFEQLLGRPAAVGVQDFEQARADVPKGEPPRAPGKIVSMKVAADA